MWFAKNRNINIDNITIVDAREYFHYMIIEKKYSVSLIRLHRFAISLYYKYIHKKMLDLSFVEGIKTSKTLPVILSRKEIDKILANIMNIKHRTMISLLYSAGMRVSEVVKLKVRDINLDELTIHIKQGKGKN